MHAELIAEAREWADVLDDGDAHARLAAGCFRRLADALDAWPEPPDEEGLATLRKRAEDRGLFHWAEGAALLAALAQRDDRIADLWEDLERKPGADWGRQAELAEVLALVGALLRHRQTQRLREGDFMGPAWWDGYTHALNLLAGDLEARGPAPEPTPPQQARERADRLAAQNARLREAGVAVLEDARGVHGEALLNSTAVADNDFVLVRAGTLRRFQEALG